jgi:hypothetical protein
MVIGDNLAYTDLYRDLSKAEQQLSRRVNPKILSVEGWQRRLSFNPVIAKIDAQPKIFIIGSDSDLKT